MWLTQIVHLWENNNWSKSAHYSTFDEHWRCCLVPNEAKRKWNVSGFEVNNERQKPCHLFSFVWSFPNWSFPWEQLGCCSVITVWSQILTSSGLRGLNQPFNWLRKEGWSRVFISLHCAHGDKVCSPLETENAENEGGSSRRQAAVAAQERCWLSFTLAVFTVEQI